ncbi:MAG: hypothetical protein ACTSR2_08060 [Candidatus Hodarchaeales archaeon]
MTLKIVKEDLDLFIKVLNAAAAVLEKDGTFLITPQDGLTLRSMDESHSAMVDLRIKPEYFSEDSSEFICDKDYLLTIDMQHLKKILQRSKKGDILTITLDEKNETLVFLYEGLGKRTFILPLLHTEKEELPPDSQSFEFKVNAKLRGGALSDFIKDASIIGGTVKITAEEGKLIFSCTEDKKGVSIEITTGAEGESEALEIFSDGKNESQYQIEIFKNLLLVDQAFATVMLSFSSEHPLRLSYMDNGINLDYMLAPMRADEEIEEESESDEDWEDEEDWDDEDDEDWDDE